MTNKLVSCKERRRLARALDAMKKKARILFTITTQFKFDYPRGNSWAIEQEKPYHNKRNGEDSLTHGMVARERFELSSAAPEAAMFDHCTTGLKREQDLFFGINTFVRKRKRFCFLYFCFFNVSSMQ